VPSILVMEGKPGGQLEPVPSCREEMHVEFRVLGPLELRLGGEAVPLRGQRLRTLLADLLVHLGEVVPRDRLVEDLWPSGAPKGAEHAIETHVSKLRTVLGGAATVARRPPGYVLEVEPGAVDSVRFEQLLEQAREAEPARAAARAADALALWRGPAYADVAYDSFAQAEIARLEELRLEAEEERIDAELALGRSSESIGELEALVAAAPSRERRHALLMLALYRTSRQADALEAFRSARDHLLDELGIEPSPELRELERRILQQDPELLHNAPPAIPTRAARRLVTVIVVEPEISLDLDPEDHDRETRRVADALGVVAGEYGAERPEPFVLVFAQEDHAERAAAAAAATRETTGARVGLASGEALVGGGSLAGAVVARARKHADEGGVPDLPTTVMPRRLDGPFVGRDEELARLRSVRAALVVGPPGIGKSRLAHELARDAFAVVGRCSSYGAASLAPLHEIAAALGQPHALVDTWAPEVPLRFRRLCEEAGQPVLVVIDDVHWADPLVVETIEHLIAQGNGTVRVLCLAREELLEERPTFLSAADRLVLEPLTSEDAQLLAGQLADVEDHVVERALAAAEGNPLFLEQFLAHATEGGKSLPPTLQSLLTARLDRLPPSERATIEHAAVIGREFSASLLAELLEARGVRQPLSALVRRGLIDPAPPATAFEERFRFRHVLIQEATYTTAPRAERARLHERLADMIGDDDELVGFHLEQAAVLRPERDRHTRRLAEDAGERLGAAGIAVWKLGNAGAAARLLGRATSLLSRGDRRRLELLCELGVALNTIGDPEGANEALEQAEELGDRRIALRAQIERAAISLLRDSKEAPAQLLEVTEAARPVFEAVGDDRSLGRAWMLGGWVLGGAYARHAAWEEAAERALVHYRRGGWPASTCLGHIATALCLGPTPVKAGIARCTELLEREVVDLVAEANVSAPLGGLYAMAGDFAESSRLLERARSIYLELGLTPALLRSWAPTEARAAFLRRDTERAAVLYSDICEELTAARGGFHLATQAAEYANVLLELGRAEEAEAWCATAERHARADDLNGRIAALLPRARLLVLEGRLEDAESVAREAVRLADATDELNLRAAAHLALADVLRPVGGDQVDAATASAVALYRQKGNAAAVDRLDRKPTAATTSPSAG
jgi:DNA-binding SARP family transcriptional activator/tetratricopeptide (TPR) repeat protein